jgi:hypothetical protein
VFGAGTRIRTADLRFTKPLLYQLSYTGCISQEVYYSLLARLQQGIEPIEITQLISLFYVFSSIFGFQWVGDIIWPCADMLSRGFLLGGTTGRTTLNGEGLTRR